MPILAALIYGLFGGMVGWLAKYLTQRAANMVVLVGVAAAAAGTAWATINAIVSGIIPAMPNGLAVALTWCIPSNFNACISAIIGTEIACAGYRWTRNVALSTAAP